MAAVHALEKELVKATKVKASDYEDRQDFLAAVSREAHKLKDDAYDSLSDDAATWHKTAVDALNAKEEIPEFDGSIGGEAPEEVEDEPEADEPEADDDAEDDEGDPTEDNLPDPADDDDEDEPEPAPKAKGKGKAAPVKAAKAAKTEKPAKAEKASKPEKKQIKYADLDGSKDRFGIVNGTKTSQAVALYVKGASSKDIMDALEGRYYNILKKLATDGHHVEKRDNGKIYVTHKDDMKAKKAKK